MTQAGASANGRFVHDAFVYASAEHFLAGTLPFIRDGLLLGEPILAAPKPENITLLRAELGHEADRVDWADNPTDHKPVQRMGVFLRYIADQLARGARRVRLLGEPVWPADSEEGIAEWTRYESALNLALALHPVWLVCPYDARELPTRILASSFRTHPIVGFGNGRQPSSHYVEPAHFSRGLDDEHPFAPPPPEALERSFELATDAREFVVAQARAAGLSVEQVEDVKLGADELATNVFRHAAGPAIVRTWVSGPMFVCEVSDVGPGIEDPFPGYVIPEPTQTGGWGLSIARQVADVVEIRSGPSGTTARLHMRLF